MKVQNLGMKKFLMGFVNAFNGIKVGFGQRNMKVHGFVAIVVGVAGWYFGISRSEWFVVIFLIAAVWAAELVNTAIESEANIMRDTLGAPYSVMGKAKDLAAGAVLVVAIAAAIIGLAIFVPRVVGMIF